MLVDELRAVLPQMRAVAVAKAGESGVKSVIGRRFAIYPQPERNEGEWAGWWKDYYNTLQGVPLASLEAAMQAWIAGPDAQFLPKPGELLALSRTVPTKSATLCHRATLALKLTVRPLVLTAKGDREAVRRMAAETIAILEARAPQRPAFKFEFRAETDDAGVTAEMREALARRAQASGE